MCIHLSQLTISNTHKEEMALETNERTLRAPATQTSNGYVSQETAFKQLEEGELATMKKGGREAKVRLRGFTLRGIRKDRGYSKTFLAGALNVHRSTVECIELGIRVHKHTIQRFVKGWGLTIKELDILSLANVERMLEY